MPGSTLSFRDVEDLLTERGIDVSNETVRRWFLKFGRLIARNHRRYENLHNPPALCNSGNLILDSPTHYLVCKSPVTH